MARKGSITLEEIQLIEVDSDPSQGGLEAPSGSLAIHTDSGIIYSKAGSEWINLGDSKNIKRVAPIGAPYSSITEAISSCDTPSSSNRYIILLQAGTYVENQINLPTYISIVGVDEKAVVIQPAGNHHVINLEHPYNYLSFFSIHDAPVGYSAINCVNADNYSIVHKVHIQNCSNGISVTASTTDTYLYTEYCDIEECTTSIVVNGNGALAYSQNENLYIGNYSSSPADVAITVSGMSEYIMQSGSIENIAAPNTGDGLRLFDGGSVRISNTNIVGWDNAIIVENTGSAPNLELRNPIFTNNITDFSVQHLTATGYFLGYSEYLKRSINSTNFFIANKDDAVVTVAKKGGDFSSIKAAIDSITDSSSAKPYTITVGPGIFSEDEIISKPYIDIKGTGHNVTVVTPNGNHSVFNLDKYNKISDLTIKDVSAGFYAVVYADKGETGAHHSHSRISNIHLDDCDGGVFVTATDPAKDTHLFIDFINIEGTFSRGIYVLNNGGDCACADIVHLTSTSSVTTSIDLEVSGVGSEVMLHAAMLIGNGSNTGIKLQNGVDADISASVISGYDKGLIIPNNGAISNLVSSGLSFKECTSDLEILRPGVTGSLSITADRSKLTVVDGAEVSFQILGVTSPAFTTAGPIYYAQTDYSKTSDISQLLMNTPAMGVIDGGQLSAGAGLSLNIASGYGYQMNGTPPLDIATRRDWNSTSLTLPASSTVFVYFNENYVLTSNVAEPDTEECILLGRVTTDASSIIYIEQTELRSHHMGNTLSKALRDAIGPVYTTGSLVTEAGTRQLNVSSGKYYFGEHIFSPTGATPVSFDTYYQSATPGQWVRTANQSTVSNTLYDDDSGTLASIPTGKFVKHLVLVMGGPSEKYILVYGQELFDSASLAETGALPVIPEFMGTYSSFAKVCSIVTGPDSSTFSMILDERPRVGFSASSVSGGGGGVTDHGDLTGLADDDHTQYILASGARAFTGNIDVGGNQITNVGLVDGVDVSAHASRHLPNGADPLTTGTPSSIGTTNSEGIANAFARQDHIHNHGVQTDPAHHAVATGSDNGFMSSLDKTKLDGIEAGATAYTDEKAQDAVGAALSNTATINLSYNDVLNQFSAAVNDGSITDSKLASGIDAAKIDGGTVTNTEFGYLSNVTSDIQAQLDGKQPTGDYITALTGDVTAAGPGSAAATLANSGVVAGTYSLVTVDSKGRVTFGSNTGSITRYSYFTTSPNVNSNATYTTVAELTTASLPTGLYRVSFRGRAQSASTTNGTGVRISNGTAVVSTVAVSWAIAQGANGVSQKYQYDQTAANTNVTSTSANAANTDFAITGDGVIRITSAGTLVIQLRSELNGTASTLLADSSLVLELL
jgi:pectin methylesterase-like acyl-CoA thioesterase